MKYKLIIFDLDGTLINSINGLSKSINTVLQKNNFPTHSVNKVKTFVGNGIRNLVIKATPPNVSSDSDIDNYFSQMTIEYSKYWDFKMEPYHGIIDLLNYLQENNILLAVNTNKDEATSKLIINRFFPKINFTHIVGRDTLESKKPEPGAVYHITKELNIPLYKTLYIGDSEVDFLTAQNAQIDYISVNWGFRTENELKDKGISPIISTTKEILDLINS